MLINRKLPVWAATLTFSTHAGSLMAFATLCAPEGQKAYTQQIWLYYALGAVSIRLFAARLPDLLGAHNLLVHPLPPVHWVYLARGRWLRDALLSGGRLRRRRSRILLSGSHEPSNFSAHQRRQQVVD